MKIIFLPKILKMFAPLVGKVPAGHLWYLLRKMRNEKPHRFNGQTRINTFFPPYPSPAFDRFCQAVISRQRTPFSAYLAVTSECPCQCPHCSYGRRPKGAPPTDRLLALIDQIKSLGVCTLGFTGGEPLLRDDLDQLLRAAKPELATVVFTTGHALDDRRARQLAEAGVDCITIGIESANAQSHDAVRRTPGSFDQAARAAQSCHQAGLYTAISTIGTREKIRTGELERMHQLGESWNVGEFRLLAPVATGGMSGCTAFMLSPQERQYLFDFHVRHNRLPHGPAVASFAYLESQELFGCGAGYHHLFIDAAGEVCPCDLAPLSFGNAFTEPLSEIWQRMGQFFPRPRCRCLMGQISADLNSTNATLPLPREKSEAMCSAIPLDKQLPEGYRRLLRR